MSDTEPTKAAATPKTETFKEEFLTAREHMDADKHWIGESLPAPSIGEIRPIGDEPSAGVSPYPARADHIHTLVGGTGDKVSIIGDTMTGDLYVPHVFATAAQHGAVTAHTRKDYVDAQDNSLYTDYTTNRVSTGGDSMGTLYVNSGLLYVHGSSGSLRLYSADLSNQYGYLYGDNSQLQLGTSGALPILFVMGSVERARIANTDGYLYVGKTAASHGYVTGLEFMTWGTISSTWDANGGALSLGHMGGADTSGGTYVNFTRFTTSIGTITQNGTGAVSYNTTSHGPWKDVIGELDDNEAIEQIKKWRPVAFRWKIGEDGLNSENGTPQGEVQHGFIAQEMAEVQPSAVTEGYGTEAAHKDWVVRHKEHHKKTEEAEKDKKKAPEPFTEMDPFRSWSMDNSKLIPDMTAAIQALIRRTEKLEERIEELENGTT